MQVRGLLLDVEGVLVADKRYRAVPSAVEFVAAARAAGCPLRLITNNTTDDRDTIIAKLHAAGFDFAPDELHTCTAVAADYLHQHGARRCLVLGTPNLRDIFARSGFEPVESSEVDAVIVGLDTELTFERLRLACDALVSHGALFVALHRNRLYPDALGRAAPSVGAIVAALEYATQITPAVMGKPSQEYFQRVLDDLGNGPQGVLLVSDDPFSDLAGGRQMGLLTAFVLSGKYRSRAVLEKLPPEQQPDLVAERIGDLLTDGDVTLGDG